MVYAPLSFCKAGHTPVYSFGIRAIPKQYPIPDPGPPTTQRVLLPAAEVFRCAPNALYCIVPRQERGREGEREGNTLQWQELSGTRKSSRHRGREMDISTQEAWQEVQLQDQQQLAARYPDHPEYVQGHIDYLRSLDEKRAALLARFPYAVTAEGDYSEFSYAIRWGWQNIGPPDGPCIFHLQADYPGCPLILETESVTYGTRTDTSGAVIPWVRKKYSPPAEHGHEGEWSFLWFGKTGYDWGYCAFYFGNESDHANFLLAFPTFTWSEEWKQEGL